MVAKVITVVRDGPDQWRALRDGVVVGEMRAFVRPDDRCALYFGDAELDARGPLLDAAIAALPRDLYTEADESAPLDAETTRGFTITRREHLYVLPTAVPDRALPPGIHVISAADADGARWAALDDALREDVPGSAGWHNDPETFAAGAVADPQFDANTYLIAVDTATDDYVGLVRVWRTTTGPRLGLIATDRDHRRIGLATALLRRAFATVTESEARCEVDQTNIASNALLTGLGARRVGGSVELVRYLAGDGYNIAAK